MEEMFKYLDYLEEFYKKEFISLDNYYHIIEFTEDMSLEKYQFLESEVKLNDIIQ